MASLILFDPPQADRFVTCICFYNVAAAGASGADQPAVDPGDHRQGHSAKTVRAGPTRHAGTPDFQRIE
jgi:hypothetical protein